MLLLDELLLVLLQLHHLLVLHGEILLILAKETQHVFAVVKWVLVACKLYLSRAIELGERRLEAVNILVTCQKLSVLSAGLIFVDSILISALILVILRGLRLFLDELLRIVVFFLGGANNGKVSPRLDSLGINVAILLLILIIILLIYLI